MKDEELLRRLGSLPDEIQPRKDVWARIDRAIDAETAGAPEPANPRRPTGRIYTLRALAVAASILLVVALAAILIGRSSSLDAWTIRLVDGTSIASNQLRKGESLSTDSTTRFVASTDIGEVLVERNTRITLEELRSDRQVLSLERGEIYARIIAPPRVFIVQTPSVTAIDLGCEYRLAVDSLGDGVLEVVSGWVALEFGDREWFVPAGASSAIDGSGGPAAPVFADATELFQAAANTAYESRIAGSSGLDSAVLAQLLGEARGFDSLTLWHLLPATTPGQREEIYDTLLRIDALPEGFEKAAFVDRVPAAMDWLRIHLEESVWFRPELIFDSTLDLPFSSDPGFTKKKKKPALPERITR